MKKILMLFMILFLSFAVFAQENKITVGLWVVVDDETFRTRVLNEVTSQMHSSEEWPFEVKFMDWDTDVHVIISGMEISDVSRYAWGITYTPIHEPIFTNGTAAVSENTISGMNWVSRMTVQYVEEQLYILFDAMSEGDI
jgi:hypothetical protein